MKSRAVRNADSLKGLSAPEFTVLSSKAQAASAAFDVVASGGALGRTVPLTFAAEFFLR